MKEKNILAAVLEMFIPNTDATNLFIYRIIKIKEV